MHEKTQHAHAKSMLQERVSLLSDDRRAFLAHVERVDLNIQRQLRVQQSRFAMAKHDMEGMTITDLEIEAIIDEPLGVPKWAMGIGLNGPLAETYFPTWPASRIERMKDRLQLSEAELNVLILSWLPMIDGRYSTIYAYMQDNAQARHLSADLAFNLLCANAFEKLDALPLLQPGANLIRHELITLAHLGGAARSLNQTVINPNPRVLMHVLGDDALDPELVRWVSVHVPCDRSHIPDADLTKQFSYRLSREAEANRGLVTLLRGPAAKTYTYTLLEAAYQAQVPVMRADLAMLPEDQAAACSSIARLLLEANLREAGLLLESLGDLANDRPELLRLLDRDLACFDLPVFAFTASDASLPVLFKCRQHVIETGKPSLTQRTTQLNLASKAHDLAGRIDFEYLARRFSLRDDDIDRAFADATAAARQRIKGRRPDQTDLTAAFRHRAQRDYGGLASRVTPRRSRADLVVNESVLRQLDLITASLRHRERVLDHGFAEKLNYGLGISALFYGPAGTGKTMLAEVIAGEMDVDLVRVDLASVVNKYIGETEKHIGRIFDLAEADAGVLFFDEADALFGRRSEVKDAHDRHANIQVSYLLQRLESYSGLVVLATNNRAHLDEAFTRRLTFIVNLEFPDAQMRNELWKRAWPGTFKLARGIDFADLAERLPFTGANIRNVALLASWIAAENGRQITRADILAAANCEMEKAGMIATNLT